LKGFTDFYRWPRNFYSSHCLNLHFNPWWSRSRWIQVFGILRVLAAIDFDIVLNAGDRHYIVNQLQHPLMFAATTGNKFTFKVLRRTITSETWLIVQLLWSCCSWQQSAASKDTQSQLDFLR